MSLVFNASTEVQLTELLLPALSAKSMISFCLETKLYNRERLTGHGLGDEEKKDTSNDFELHLELGNSRGITVVLIDFWFSKMSLI